jgi:hypothetical protein
MSQHLNDLQNVPDSRELELARADLAAQNKLYVEIGKEVALLATSNIPIWGTIQDGLSALGNLFTGNWGDAALDVVGMIPLGGDAVKSTVKGAKLAKRAAVVAARIQELRNKVRRLDDLAKKAAAARKYWAKKKGAAYERLVEDLKKCKTRECRQKKIADYRNNKFKQIPRGGKWAGAPGNSKWTPEPGSEAAKALKDWGQSGIVYKNGKPDFGPFVKKGPDGRRMEVKIDNMRGDSNDFTQARAALKRRYPNLSKKDEGFYTWHHKEDGSTMQLVDRRIHDRTLGGGSHAGGDSMVRDPAY